MSRLRLEPKYVTEREEAEDIEYVKSVQNEPVEDYQEYRKRRKEVLTHELIAQRNP